MSRNWRPQPGSAMRGLGVGAKLLVLTARAAWYFMRASLRKPSLGMAFDRMGRWLGARRLLRGHRDGLELLLHPIESVRYVEYAAVEQLLPSKLGRCLDLSSPRLFSLYVYRTHHPELVISNPDQLDLQETESMFSTAGLRRDRISFRSDDLATLAEGSVFGFDTIWSISVVEHVAGSENDTDAVRLLFGSLARGGTLIITVPVDRLFREEFSEAPMYPTQPRQQDGRYFFQRLYDKQTLYRRLIDALPVQPIAVHWFGERVQGWWPRYRAAADKAGVVPHVDDVWVMSEQFKCFDSWEAMPGLGIAVIAWRRP